MIQWFCLIFLKNISWINASVKKYIAVCLYKILLNKEGHVHINIQCNKVKVIVILFFMLLRFCLISSLENYFMDYCDTWNIGSLWHHNWHHNKCRSHWPIFHGPVILPYILNVIWYMNIILWIMNQYDPIIDLKANVGHCDLYFSVQWYYVTSCRQFDVLLSHLVIMWPIFHSPVVLSYISHYFIPKCHVYI